MAKNTFDVLFLIGRPASGKSEIIHFLKGVSKDERKHLHVHALEIFDDFPMLWTWFEEDDLLTRKFGLPRLHSDQDGYFLHREYWHLLVERLSLDYQKHLRDCPSYHENTTALIEFSRGAEHGGYGEAFCHFDEALLSRSAILYVNVSFDESLRKNRLRFNPNRPDSILEHGLSDEKMERLYRQDDWAILAPEPKGFLQVGRVNVPYIVFENQDDVTTGKPGQLATRLGQVMGELWDLRQRS